MAAACLLAAVYGAVHNQISYTVAPEYFHGLKFQQFRLAPEFHNRIGAGIVGVLASWWMGLVIGMPIYVAGLFVRGTGPFVRSFMRAALVVVCVTLAMGLGALIWAKWALSAENLPGWMAGRDIADPVAFAQVGTMHNFSYLGGQVGLLVGLMVIIRAAARSRRADSV